MMPLACSKFKRLSCIVVLPSTKPILPQQFRGNWFELKYFPIKPNVCRIPTRYVGMQSRRATPQVPVNVKYRKSQHRTQRLGTRS